MSSFSFENNPIPRRESEQEKKIRETAQELASNTDIGGPFKLEEGGLEDLGNLISKLENNLDKYDVILSDEASARIPSLVMRKIINKKKDEIDADHVDFQPITGGRGVPEEKKESVFNLLNDVFKDDDKYALLVTEYISEGRGIRWITDFLEDQGVKYDIAAVSLNGKKDDYPESISDHLYYGSIGAEGMRTFHNTSHYSGIEKNKEDNSPFPRKSDAFYDQKKVNETRESVNIVADKFYELLKENGKQ